MPIASKPENFLVLQVDVSKHTKWLETDRLDNAKWLKKHHARKELAKQIINILKKYGFAANLWKGDGGVFFCKADGKPNYDFIVNAGDELYDLFEKWKANHKDLDTPPLDLRVSVDLEFIIAEDEPCFWTSYVLNRFLKHENVMGQYGFTISRKIHEKLSQNLQIRFKLDLCSGTKDDMVYFNVDSVHTLKVDKNAFS